MSIDSLDVYIYISYESYKHIQNIYEFMAQPSTYHPQGPKAHPPGVSGDAFARRRARRRDRALAPLGTPLGALAATLGPGSLANAEGFTGFGGKNWQETSVVIYWDFIVI